LRVDDVTQFATQLLNGLQLGVTLFLMSAGLTLVLGIMNFVNLAHGSFFMVAAYVAATTYKYTQSFIFSGFAAIVSAFAIGVVVDMVCLRKLHDRDHLAQVLATFGLTLFFNEAVRVIWGPAGIFAAVPPFLAGQIEIASGVVYPVYRLVVLATGVVTGIGLYLVIVKTRAGMIVRAAGSDRMMTAAMGVNIRTLSAAVFGAGAALAGLAGFMAAPVVAVQSGMGDPILILTLVVIVIGGIGSVRGAVLASLVVGIVDTLGRVYIPIAIGSTLPRAVSDALSPALTSMLIYLIMTAIPIFKPRGLLPASTG
jgi:branched-chain amino acid transport system permease protein